MMTFREVKPGHTIYVFDRVKATMSCEKVADVKPPHVGNMYNGGTTPMVDVVLQDGRSYAIPETVETAYTGNLAISLTLDGALAEVKSASEKAKQELARTESNKELIDKCAKIAEELNPTLKEKAETERRFANIEKGMSDIAQKVGELLNKLT